VGVQAIPRYAASYSPLTRKKSKKVGVEIGNPVLKIGMRERDSPSRIGTYEIKIFVIADSETSALIQTGVFGILAPMNQYLTDVTLAGALSCVFTLGPGYALASEIASTEFDHTIYISGAACEAIHGDQLAELGKLFSEADSDDFNPALLK
jgi:hypothetical protein